MPRTITEGQPFPMPCPACKQVAGMPFMAGTQLHSGAIAVAMRCRECGHEWRFDMPLTAERKRDSGTHVVIKPD
jgi:RNase P subunit RPR2